MRLLTTKATLAAVAAGACAISLSSFGTAHADTAPRSGDVVGVGSDTAQNLIDFLFDGAPGVPGGYNNVGNNNRAVNIDATGDANGRAVYDGTCGPVNTTTGLGAFCDSTTNALPNLLPGSVVLRTGTGPVVRPNGSGAGAGALNLDAASAAGYQGLPVGSIQFARMSRLPNGTEEGNCKTSDSGCGGLHVYQLATDVLTIASAKTTNAPAGLSASELVNIYNCTWTKWSQVPGYAGSAGSDTIHPLIPQSGSGTRNFFLADLATANGGNAVTPGTCVRTVEEHDPTGIYGDPTPADAVEPFSVGKLSLINSGYFANGAGYKSTAGVNAYTPGQVDQLNGTAPDGTATYNSSRGLYVAARQADVASTTPFQAGTSQNWVTALFAGATSVARRSSNAPLFQAAGFTQAFKDCGINPASC